MPIRDMVAGEAWRKSSVSNIKLTLLPNCMRQPEGRLTPEEEIRYKDLLRERDRERKRIKRMNPEYRRLEQERDRDRKKARRANEAFRQLEKLREKIRKERKKGIIVDEAAIAQQFNLIAPTPVEPEIIISDPLPPPELAAQQQPQQQQHQQSRQQQNHGHQQQQQQHHPPDNHRRRIHNNGNLNNITNSNNSGTGNPSANMGNINNSSSVAVMPATAHLPQLNKGLLYPAPSFPHHPLPIPALMPSLCHPILHQNLSASLYPQNGIKQEYNPGSEGPSNTQNNQTMGSGGGMPGAGNNNDDHEMPMIEPEIILQTSPEIIAAPHHFNSHAHSHHLHQQQCNMFQHMTPPAHMTAHMRAHAAAIPPPPPPTGPTNNPSQTSRQAHNPITQQH
uniref:Uncharacterized protein n=1 Tax=Glossina palpalis gambiensis TaxID=67801 RepID=A0A1B0AQ12_9MUSC